MVWIKNPPEDRDDYATFLINTDLMSILWIILPISFLLGMQVRSFRKMRLEMTQFLHGVEDNLELDHPDCRKDDTSSNNSRILSRSRDSFGSQL